MKSICELCYFCNFSVKSFQNNKKFKFTSPKRRDVKGKKGEKNTARSEDNGITYLHSERKKLSS